MNTRDWKNATPEQLNFWNLCNTKIAWNTITPLNYVGVVAASEFTVYDAAKLYLALILSCGHTGSADASTFSINLYNEANAVHNYLINQVLSWDVTAAAFKFSGNSYEYHNIWFSRIVVSKYTWMRFNGYKLTIV